MEKSYHFINIFQKKGYPLKISEQLFLLTLDFSSFLNFLSKPSLKKNCLFANEKHYNLLISSAKSLTFSQFVYSISALVFVGPLVIHIIN
jgi:hypothetical protein